MLLTVVATVVGLLTQQPARWWLYALVAIGVHFVVGWGIGPESQLWRDALAISSSRGNPSPSVWVVLAANVFGWVLPGWLLWSARRGSTNRTT